MWAHKDSENIIYIDVCRELERKPTIFCSNGKAPFQACVFHTIFYDPPHTWGVKGDFHTYPSRSKEYIDKWKDDAIPRYYGWERYDTRHKLITHIYRAEQEFNRILKDDGLLLLKWNVMSIKLHNILGIFHEWRILLKLFIKAPSQTRGKHQTYWICMEKKKGRTKQTSLI